MNARPLWVKLLHLTCEQYAFFKPTFPMDKMTVSELKHAVTAPSRFHRFVSISDLMGSIVLPFQTRIHPFRRTADSDTYPLHVDFFVLVPGGRFLITSGSSSIYLWDLGYNMRQFIEPFPLSGQLDGYLIAVAPTSDGRELLVLLECEYVLRKVSPFYASLIPPHFVSETFSKSTRLTLSPETRSSGWWPSIKCFSPFPCPLGHHTDRKHLWGGPG